MAQLDLWLDRYDDIYSDFDSRNYLKRRISEDFLLELKTAFSSKEGSIDKLVLELPASERSEEQEQMIVRNLSDFFKTQNRRKQEYYRKRKGTGILLLVTGTIVMIINILISYFYSPMPLALQSLKVLLEPAGWFFMWTAMDLLFYELQKIKAELIFYKEMAAVKWHFKSM